MNLLKEIYDGMSQDEFHLIVKAFNHIAVSEAYLTDSFMQLYGDDGWSLAPTVAKTTSSGNDSCTN